MIGPTLLANKLYVKGLLTDKLLVRLLLVDKFSVKGSLADKLLVRNLLTDKNISSRPSN